MATDDFLSARLQKFIDLRRSLAVLATRMPWSAIKAALAPKMARQARPSKRGALKICEARTTWSSVAALVTLSARACRFA